MQRKKHRVTVRTNVLTSIKNYIVFPLFSSECSIISVTFLMLTFTSDKNFNNLIIKLYAKNNYKMMFIQYILAHNMKIDSFISKREIPVFHPSVYIVLVYPGSVPVS